MSLSGYSFENRAVRIRIVFYLSISPKTMSKEQKVATKSANMLPMLTVGMRCMLWLTGVRNFKRVGLDVPFDTKVTPTSPLGDSTV